MTHHITPRAQPTHHHNMNTVAGIINTDVIADSNHDNRHTVIIMNNSSKRRQHNITTNTSRGHHLRHQSYARHKHHTKRTTSQSKCNALKTQPMKLPPSRPCWSNKRIIVNRSRSGSIKHRQSRCRPLSFVGLTQTNNPINIQPNGSPANQDVVLVA